MSYRNRQIERNLSGVVSSTIDATGGTVLVSKKGRGVKRFQSDTDLIRNTGIPAPEVQGVYNAIEYVKRAPLIVSFAIGQNYAHAGIDVKESSTVSFGENGGRDLTVFELDPTTSFNSVEINTTHVIALTGNGITAAYAGTITIPENTITKTSVKIKTGTSYVDVTAGDPDTITGSAINGTGSLNRTTGVYNFTFDGVAGTPAYYVSTIDLSSGVDLSTGGTDKFVNIEIDRTLYQNVNLGQSATTALSAIVSAINSAVGYTAAAIDSLKYIRITARVGSSTLGNVKITNPTTGISALNLVFDYTATSIESKNSVSPTGSIPKVGEKVIFDYTYPSDLSATVSHTIMTESPFNDTTEMYAASVERISGKKYRLKLYEKIKGKYYYLTEYIYSLIQEKDGFGTSIYYEDVFKDTEFRVVVNPNFVGEADPTVAITDLAGGKRGDTPTTTDISNAWNVFQYRQKWKVKKLLDFSGDSPSYVKNIIDNYQKQAHGLIAMPYGKGNVDLAIQHRQSLGMDTDKMSIFSNWLKIKDPFSGSEVWVSGLGKVGAAFSLSAPFYDGLPVAGPNDELTGVGGQLTGFEVVDTEVDYTDSETGSDLQRLNDAQINPIIWDDTYGTMIYGNRTLQVDESDTSYIHTRCIYDKIIDDVSTKVLRKQEFKINDELHRLVAKSKIDTYFVPIMANSLLNDYFVQCDNKNNSSDVLSRREFIVDIYVKAATSSEFVILRLTRLPQGAVISDFLAA